MMPLLFAAHCICVWRPLLAVMFVTVELHLGRVIKHGWQCCLLLYR